MNIEQARFNMVEQQIRPCEVIDPQVLDLLFVIKRESFVPPAYKMLAFADMEIPIGYGQVMLAPRIEARLLQEAGVRRNDRVLEIGTGSGYMAALLAARAEHVITLECVPELAEMARHHLADAGIGNVIVETANGNSGWPLGGPYDVIMLSGAVPQIPPELLSQLRVGGRLVAVVGEAPAMTAQVVTCVTEGAYHTVGIFETVIPPLSGLTGADVFKF